MRFLNKVIEMRTSNMIALQFLVLKDLQVIIMF